MGPIGRSLRLEPAGSTFATPKEIDFAAGAPNDPYGFKPTDLVVDRDGALFISDWADGQRPKRGRGRIYRVTYTGAPADKPAAPANDVKVRIDPAIAKLDLESYQERCQAQAALERRGKEALPLVEQALKQQQIGVRGRLHAVWIIARLDGAAATEKLLALAKSDPDPRVQTQALRALADLVDPVLVKHRLDAGRGDPALAERLAALVEGRDPRVQREIIVALGRLRWAGAPAELHGRLTKADPAVQHAAQQTLRQSGNWPAILKLLDEPTADPFRVIARRAVAERYEPIVVDGLIERLAREPDAARRREYADLLARVYKKPAEPWTFWGFRPPPRPAPTVAWERTEAITAALDRMLGDMDPTVRLETLRRMLREKIPAQTATLGKWLRDDRAPDRVAAILQALEDLPGSETRPLLEEVVRSQDHAAANRAQAVALFVKTLDPATESRLLTLAEGVADGPVLAGLLQATASRPNLAANPLLLRKVTSPDPDVRAQAIAALADRKAADATDPVRKLLDDADGRVRSAAATAAGKLGVRAAMDTLLKLTGDPDAAVRRSSLEALRRLGEPRVVPAAVKALADRETLLPALDALAELGGPDQAGALTEAAARNPSAEILTASARVLTRWGARANLTPAQRQAVAQALAEVHGRSGVLLAWRATGPLPPTAGAAVLAKVITGQPLPADARTVLATGLDARIPLGRAASADDTWLATADLTAGEAASVDWFAASTGLATVWLNGKVVYQRAKPGVIGPYPDRFEASLPQGRSTVVVRLSAVKENADFQLHFRRKTATADQERYSRAALSRAGNPAAGRQIFLNAEKSLCVKCHRVGDVGEKIGPELTGLGSRFSKIYIVESILEPSRTIAPAFETIAVLLKNGKSISGVKVAETDTTLTLADNQAQKHVVQRADIEDQQKQPISTMPDGTEKRLTEDEFVDLVSFLANLKETRTR